MPEHPKPRPTTLHSVTYKLEMEKGALYITVTINETGEPQEVFGNFGKTGSFERGVTELVCRLTSLALRAGVDVEEVMAQCRGIVDMEPRLNHLPSQSKFVLGIGDGIALVLAEVLGDKEAS